MSWREQPVMTEAQAVGHPAGRNAVRELHLPSPSPGRARADARFLDALVAAAKASLARGRRNLGANLPGGLWRL